MLSELILLKRSSISEYFVLNLFNIVELFCFREHYICGVSWVGGGVISVLYQNRPQNASHHALCSPPDYDCNKVRFISYLLKATVTSFKNIFFN